MKTTNTLKPGMWYVLNATTPGTMLVKDGDVAVPVEYKAGQTSFLALSNEVQHGDDAFVRGPFADAPAQNGSGGGELTPEQERSLKSVTDGSTVVSVPDSPPPYTLKQGATVQLTEYTDTLELVPSALTTAQEMRVLYSPAEARTAPLIAVPQGVTLHWAGDEEPIWEAGKDYVIQLLQTSPTRIEARLFNAPQGEKTDIFADFVSTYTESFQYPDFTAYTKAHPDWQKQKLLCYPRIWGRTSKTIANPAVYFEPSGNFSATALTFENSSVFMNINSSVTQGILSNYNIGHVKSLFVICESGGTVGLNGLFVFSQNFLTSRDSAVYINLPMATAQNIGTPTGTASSFIVRSDIRFLHHVYIHWPKAASNMQIFDKRTPSHIGVNAYAQPLSADSVIYFFTHLPAAPADGRSIKIGVDETLGVYEVDEEGNTIWRPTDAKLLDALIAVEDKGWAIAFDPATLN